MTSDYPRVRVSSQNRVGLPKEVMYLLELRAGDYIRFVKLNGKVFVEKA